MPGRFDRFIGVRDDRRSREITRVLVGMRELAAAAGILAIERPRPVRWLWARVAGDVLDLALLGRALASRPEKPGRIVGAIGAVLGITAADVFAATRLAGEAQGSTAQQAPEQRATDVRAAITVWRPVEEVYGFWRDFGNLPGFMDHLESVQVSADGRSHWKAKAPGGRTVDWDAEVTEERPNELIAWRSLPGADVENSGSVRFETAPGGEGTEMHLEIHYDAPGGAVGMTVAKLFGEEPTQQVKDDLRRFKQVMETGEVVRSEGSPEGQTARRLRSQRPAHPPAEPVGAGRRAS
jgi:uncharacterized membrane protein